jgi:viroplasmin and RNaseH domain-containing protein
MDQKQDLPGEIRDLRQRLAAMEARLAAVEGGIQQQRLEAARPRFYVVVVGRRTGVFTTAEEANEQTLAFPNSSQRMFHTMEEAVAYFNAHVGIPPIPAPVWAVARGRNPGVYASAEQANAQTHGFRNFMQRRCRTMEEAHAYIAEFRDPAPAQFPLFVIDREPDGDDDEQEEDENMNG